MLIHSCDDPRLLEGLRHSCGPLFMDALEDPEVIEIMLTPDGSLWIERHGQDREWIGGTPVAQGRLVLSQVASGLNLTVNKRSPIVEDEFPLDGSRFEGTFPLIIGPGPSFSLRRRASRVFILTEYTASGSISPEVVNTIEDAVLRRLNIAAVGGTSSGRTTFVNAVIDAIYRLTPSHRLLILEDTAELQSKNPNVVFFHTSVLANVDTRTPAKVSMHYAPKRILIDEVRNAVALELLKLWNTGHPGGVNIFHVGSVEEALPRLEELVEEAGLGPKQKPIGWTVDLAVYMGKTQGNKRRISSIVKVNRFNHKEEVCEKETLYTVAA